MFSHPPSVLAVQTHLHPCMCGWWGSSFQSSCLPGKHFISWALSLEPPLISFIKRWLFSRLRRKIQKGLPLHDTDFELDLEPPTRWMSGYVCEGDSRLIEVGKCTLIDVRNILWIRVWLSKTEDTSWVSIHDSLCVSYLSAAITKHHDKEQLIEGRVCLDLGLQRDESTAA